MKIFRELGIKKGFKYLRKMDMPPTKYDGEASALGGMRAGYTVAEMTAGFAMIANNGKHNKPHLIQKIVDSNGDVIYEFEKHHQPKTILKPSVSFELTKMLQKVVTDEPVAISAPVSQGSRLPVRPERHPIITTCGSLAILRKFPSGSGPVIRTQIARLTKIFPKQLRSKSLKRLSKQVRI